MFDLSFYRDKRVLVTGHSGFKGTWMCVVLANAGAKVIGYSSFSKTEERLYDLAEISDQIVSIKGDVRDLAHLLQIFEEYRPEIVIHMAAQPIVKMGYQDPVETYSTNVMGTVNVLEAVRCTPSVKSFLNVTTDKVYENKEWEWGYRECDPLDGFDPYSNSKSCSELVTHSYQKSFFKDRNVAISTARAGNVIGGGDFAANRIIPDCVRAVSNHEEIVVRNPYSTRPYQHVLEPIYVYLMIAAKQYEKPEYAGWYNVGPDDSDCFQTSALVDLFVKYWGDGAGWTCIPDGGPHEANFLKLDSSKLKRVFQWSPRWTLDQAVEKTVEWSKVWVNKENVRKVMNRQIMEFLTEDNTYGKVEQ